MISTVNLLGEGKGKQSLSISVMLKSNKNAFQLLLDGPGGYGKDKSSV
jgi:hypothetical protein